MVMVLFQGSCPYLVGQHEEMNYVSCVSKTVNKLKRENVFIILVEILLLLSRVYHILILNQRICLSLSPSNKSH